MKTKNCQRNSQNKRVIFLYLGAEVDSQLVELKTDDKKLFTSITDEISKKFRSRILQLTTLLHALLIVVVLRVVAPAGKQAPRK